MIMSLSPSPWRRTREAGVDPGLWLSLRQAPGSLSPRGWAEDSQEGPKQVPILALWQTCCASPDKPPSLSVSPAFIKQRDLG